MNINQIIGSFFSGKSGDEELEALEQWKKEAQENIKALEEMKKIAELSNGLKGYEDFDVDGAWEKFEEHSITDSEQSDVASPSFDASKKPNWNQWIKIAAVFVVLFGSLHLFMNGFEAGQNDKAPAQYVAKDISKAVVLDDGSNIILDANAVLIESETRKTNLTGRAFFDVAKSKETTFEIGLPHGNVTVLGTQFTVLAKENYTEIFVEEGSVRFDLEGAKSQILKVGDLLKVSGKEMILVKNVDNNYSSWRLKRLVFSDNSIQEVVSALNRHYKNEIILDNPRQFEKCSFTTRFVENQTLEDVLNEFGISHSLKYEIINQKYHIIACKC